MKTLLENFLEECRGYAEEGSLATYIPELANQNMDDFGVCIVDGTNESGVGDFEKEFTIQSICKPFLLLMALIDSGEVQIRRKIGVEATGKPFNAIDYSRNNILSEHINPMVNIGAIAICSFIKGENGEDKFSRFLEFLRLLSGNPNLKVDEAVFASEKKTGDRNRAFAYLLKGSGVIDTDVDDTLDVYFRACSVLVTCKDLANLGFLLANHGVDKEGNQLVERRYTRFITAILATSGMYDGSGDFAIRVGIPAKSGVGGGIMALAPKRFGIGIYSPSLDKKGNSVAGIKLLEKISHHLDLSMF